MCGQAAPQSWQASFLKASMKQLVGSFLESYLLLSQPLPMLQACSSHPRRSLLAPSCAACGRVMWIKSQTISLTLSNESKVIIIFVPTVCWNFSTKNLDIHKSSPLSLGDCLRQCVQGLPELGQDGWSWFMATVGSTAETEVYICVSWHTGGQCPPRSLGVWHWTSQSYFCLWVDGKFLTVEGGTRTQGILFSLGADVNSAHSIFKSGYSWRGK